MTDAYFATKVFFYVKMLGAAFVAAVVANAIRLWLSRYGFPSLGYAVYFLAWATVTVLAVFLVWEYDVED